MTAPADQPPSRLTRTLGTGDAVVVGLGAMIGAGVFATFGPAAAVAGSGLVPALALAGCVAYANATSSARLAARHPQAGGTYLYGRERLGPFWGHLAGWSFVVGKTASCAAMALTFAAYLAPAAQRPVAVAAVVAVTAVNLRGVAKTALASRVILALVLAALAVVVGAALLGGTAQVERLGPAAAEGGALGLLRAAGLLFFAFAGYARIATLGEEVRDPARTIPRAIPVALAVAFLVYLAVGAAALAALGARGLADSAAPLVAVVEAGRFAASAPLVRAGAIAAALGVLLSLTAGVSRTAFAMAANGDLPRGLAAVSAGRRTPWAAEVAVAVAVSAALLVVDLRGAIGFSSFGVLVYYGVANASALTLPGARPSRALALAGLAGCALLAFSLPPSAVLGGLAVTALGAGLFALRHAR